MRHPPVVALLARRIDRRVHGIEYAADEDRAVARGSAGPFEHRRQVAEGKAGPGRGQRSEEHTSELQSLMRISYAVFCLKKKTHKSRTKIDITSNHKSTKNHESNEC